MKDIIFQISQTTGVDSIVLVKSVISFIIVVTILIIKKLTNNLIEKNISDVKALYFWRNSVNYTLYILGIFLVGALWIERFQTIGTFLGLVSAGIFIALKDPLLNLVAWLFIIIRKPYEVGDRIQIGTHVGDVLDINVFQTTLNEVGAWVDADQSTGRLVMIPNGQVFTVSQINYTKGFHYIWHEIPVIITYESNWRKAKNILNEILENKTIKYVEPAEENLDEVSRKMLISYSKLTPIVYTSNKENGILLTMRFICDPKYRRSTHQEIWEEIYDKFLPDEEIHLAYITRRMIAPAPPAQNQ